MNFKKMKKPLSPIFYIWENLQKRGTKMKIMLTLFLLTSVVNSDTIEKHSKRTDGIVANSIEMIERSNPETDLNCAIRKKDFRFIGIMGYSLIIPGVKDYYRKYEKSNGIRVIEGTSDVISSKKVEYLNKIASSYAKEYNKLLIKYLKKHPNKMEKMKKEK